MKRPYKPASQFLMLGGPNIHSCDLKHKLLKENIFEEKCSVCGITSWNSMRIVLELDHINGIKTDNRLENLRIICPNCHSQTPTFRSKNRKTVRHWENIHCKYCNKEFRINPARKRRQVFCSKQCGARYNHVSPNKPPKDILEKELWEYPSMVLAKKYCVSDSTICDWTESYGLKKPHRGYWAKIHNKKLCPISKEEMAALLPMETIEVLSKKFKVGQKVFGTWLKELGLKPMPSSYWPTKWHARRRENKLSFAGKDSAPKKIAPSLPILI